jgi:hypothetical protein
MRALGVELMWILGLVVYYLFHRIAFVYYLGIFAKSSMQRPVASMYRWFHVAIPAVSIVLLLASGLFFYLSDPWLPIIPAILLGVSWLVIRIKYGDRMNNIIKKATEIQVRMERDGRPQTEINKAIYLGATGRLYTLVTDSDLKSFLRYCVLSQVIGFDAHEDFMRSIEKSEDPKYVSVSDKIDAGVDHFYRYWSDHYDYMVQMKQ